ncbi:hypothetical protein L618_004300000220, partial [Rhodococcus rhodochrous J45]
MSNDNPTANRATRRAHRRRAVPRQARAAFVGATQGGTTPAPAP